MLLKLLRIRRWRDLAQEYNRDIKNVDPIDRQRILFALSGDDEALDIDPDQLTSERLHNLAKKSQPKSGQSEKEKMIKFMQTISGNKNNKES